MAKKEPIPKDANPDFKEVMRAVRGKNPYQAKREKEVKKKFKEIDKALRQHKGRHRRRSGDESIDTGMFDN